ncbi:MAG: hypothetical protein E7Z80_08005 [Methanobrevibacter thaueri]|nr:hypothetical protein [Methanobrevibacter thaueri]
MTYNRIQYIDALKFIAIFAVIAIHVFSLNTDAEILHFKINTFHQIFRFAVPIFLMITGALFLNKHINLKEYFKKRFNRVIYPLIFFSILLFVFFKNTEFLYYYWYAWMMIGVLFTIPIINKFIQNSTEKEIEYYIIVFVFFSIIQQVFTIYNIKYALDITFFITPVSYLILGYYLSIKEFKSPSKIILISLVVFVISTICKIKFGSFIFNNSFHTYLDLSLFQILQSTAIFLIIKYLYSSKEGIFKSINNLLNYPLINKIILSISKSSYGMYLIQHPLIYSIIKPEFVKLSLSGSGTLILSIIIIICVFLISWIIIMILGKIPYLNKLIGYY